MKIVLPDNVQSIIDRLTEYGYEAYAVGGCVRDSIIHRVPGDWDITTSAKPEEVKKIFRRTIDTGIAHGTVTVMIGREGYEITTYRIDGEYEDGRHPKKVEFTASLTEDLRRRDFTINAMAYNDIEGIVDRFDGVGDLEKGIIRCVGNPYERFSEDALRMLRAVRFSAQLGFDIEENTRRAIEELAPTIEKVSRERIHTEFGKILLSDRPEYFIKAVELGLTQYVFRAMEGADIALGTKLVSKVRKDIAFRYAAILIGLESKMTENALRSLKLDNATIGKAAFLIKFLTEKPTDDRITIRHLASRYTPQQMYEGLEFAGDYYGLLGDRKTVDMLDTERAELDAIVRDKDCLDMKNLAVKGSDLASIGIAPGRQMGDLLKLCLECVLCNPELNTKEYLIDYVRKTSS